MSGDPAPSVPSGSKVALTVLVVLVVLSPWPFGSVHLRTTQAIALVSLATALGAFLWDGWHRQLQLPPRAILWPLLGLWALAVFQLIPIPEGLHRWIAPGSAAVWYPDVPAAAAVLGPGPHPISLYPDATRRWLAFATGVVGLALAAAPALRNRRLLLRATTAVVAGSVAVAMYGFVARLAFGNKLYGIWSVPTVAPFGPFVSKNHFAGYVEVAALLTIGLAAGLADEAQHGPGRLSWIESGRSKWVVIAWGAALVLVLAVPVSLSRGGVISLTVGLACFVLMQTWAHKGSPLSATGLVGGLAGLGAGVLFLIGVLPSEARDRVLTLTGVMSDESGSYRLVLWGDTLRVAASSPCVGSGFGAYQDALPRFKTTAGHLGIEHAENDHLETLAEGGLLAVLLAAGSALALQVLALKLVRARERHLARSLLAATLAGGVALFVHSVFDFNLRIPSNALMAALLFSIAVAAVLLTADAAEVMRRAATAGPIGLLAASLLVTVGTPWAEPPWDAAALARVTTDRTDLRRSSLDAELVAYLRRRPAYAPGWVNLGWLRRPASRQEGPALARWGLSLDPRHEELARASASLRDAMR